MRHRALALGDIAPLATGFHEGTHFVVILEFAFLDRGLDANDLACLDAIAAINEEFASGAIDLTDDNRIGLPVLGDVGTTPPPPRPS
jgi:hypothetical protein